jgi:hypothetical protein
MSILNLKMERLWLSLAITAFAADSFANDSTKMQERAEKILERFMDSYEGKVEKEIYYSKTNVLKFDDYRSMYCDFTRARLGIIAYSNGLGAMEPKDKSTLKWILEHIK